MFSMPSYDHLNAAGNITHARPTPKKFEVSGGLAAHKTIPTRALVRHVISVVNASKFQCINYFFFHW